MPNHLTYTQQRAKKIIQLTRDLLSDLPASCVDFIRDLELTCSPLTRYVYARDLNIFFSYLYREIPDFSIRPIVDWTDADLDRVSARHISLFMANLTLYFDEDGQALSNHESGKMRKLSTLRSFFKWMYKRQRIHQDNSVLIDMPKRHKKPILRLERNEIERMLDAADEGTSLTEKQKTFHKKTRKRDVAMLSLFLGTGIRVSECVGIDLSDVDFSLKCFLVTRKGGNQSILYMPDEVCEVMKAYYDERIQMAPKPGHEQAYFLSIQRTRMGVRAVENMVKKYAAIAAPLKRRLSPHKLRSTFGTQLYQETGDIYLVADVLGHADINVTRKHYADMTEDHRRKAAEHTHLRQEPNDGAPPK